jgi:predicted NUDIX family NTP pyrophosphohydrolase
MAKISAGLLMYRGVDKQLQVLLVHPGGPFFRNKDDGAWTIPKGEPSEGEALLAAAQREFHEETGFHAEEPFLPLASIKQKGGKTVHAWACAGDCDPQQLVSNSFTIEWPPKSGKQTSFPEIDRAAWFPLEEARRKINPAQVGLLENLAQAIDRKSGS